MYEYSDESFAGNANNTGTLGRSNNYPRVCMSPKYHYILLFSFISNGIEIENHWICLF